ncbi:MAG: hypothetical protein PHP95_16630 [Desulfuromonadaceae bacterium]|nr:hypothetical protein [Desulfuromonadaceae bacterium]MDD2850077.1 hypothetical protein [Desulfuromonadaceae bacterium]MDD4131865.1 hypothetical protein [Desulfuromonadaceae bacterium]
MREKTMTVTVKEMQELRKGFLMLKGLFETSGEYLNRLVPKPSEEGLKAVLANNLVVGQTKAHGLFEKAKKLEAGNAVECVAA